MNVSKDDAQQALERTRVAGVCLTNQQLQERFAFDNGEKRFDGLVQ